MSRLKTYLIVLILLNTASSISTGLGIGLILHHSPHGYHTLYSGLMGFVLTFVLVVRQGK